LPEIKIDQIVRSHRKTIGLQITNDARLIVRAPHFASEDFIFKLIHRKESWIKSKQDYFKQRQNKSLVRKFVPGEEFLFLGQSYPLIVIEDLPLAVVMDRSLMISPMALGNARDHLECWYRTQALEYITQRVEYYAQISDLKYRSIRVNNATTRWGSCGYKDTLNFTWRLIMAPARVVDYVIIHELMHLKQKNHSGQFWAEVARMMPDYKQDERWLKKSGHLLAWDNKIDQN
jgi:predicted metal-dependent hydrolase